MAFLRRENCCAMEKVNLLWKLFQFGILTVFMDKILLENQYRTGRRWQRAECPSPFSCGPCSKFCCGLHLSLAGISEYVNIQTHLCSCWCRMFGMHVGVQSAILDKIFVLLSCPVTTVAHELGLQCHLWNNCIAFKSGGMELGTSSEIIAQHRQVTKHVHSSPELGVRHRVNLN